MLEENVFTNGPWKAEKPRVYSRLICSNRVGTFYWRNIAVFSGFFQEEEPEFPHCVFDFTQIGSIIDKFSDSGQVLEPEFIGVGEKVMESLNNLSGGHGVVRIGEKDSA
jgi:hypothetical protein